MDLFSDTAFAFFRFRARGQLKGDRTPHEPTGRVTMVFRRAPEGWRAIHYHESALAAQAQKVKTRKSAATAGHRGAV
jgi:ketosteroid isomerase-like protein